MCGTYNLEMKNVTLCISLKNFRVGTRKVDGSRSGDVFVRTGVVRGAVRLFSCLPSLEGARDEELM